MYYFLFGFISLPFLLGMGFGWMINNILDSYRVKDMMKQIESFLQTNTTNGNLKFTIYFNEDQTPKLLYAATNTGAIPLTEVQGPAPSPPSPHVVSSSRDAPSSPPPPSTDKTD